MIKGLVERRALIGLPPTLSPGGLPPKGDLSVHRIKIWDECRKQYRFNYVDEPRAKKLPGYHLPMVKGSVVHKALEFAAREVLGGMSPIKAEGGYDEKLMRLHLERAASLQKCDAPTFRGAWSILKGVCQDLDFSKAVAVEEGWTHQLRGGTVVGQWDRIDIDDEFVTIWDYKSGERVESEATLEVDDQVTFYLAKLYSMIEEAKHFGQFLKLRMKVWYLASNRIQTIDWTPEIQETAWAYAESKLAAQTAAKSSENGYPADLGRHCLRCPFRDRCEEFAAAHKVAGSVLSLGDVPDENLLAERQRISALAKLFEEQRHEIDRYLMDRLEATGGTALIGGGLKAKVVTPTMTRLPEPSEVARLIEEATGLERAAVMGEISTVNSKKLKEFLSQFDKDYRGKIEAKVDEATTAYFSTPRMDVRRMTGFGD